MRTDGGLNWNALCRIDTQTELEYYRHGGILLCDPADAGVTKPPDGKQRAALFAALVFDFAGRSADYSPRLAQHASHFPLWYPDNGITGLRPTISGTFSNVNPARVRISTFRVIGQQADGAHPAVSKPYRRTT